MSDKVQLIKEEIERRIELLEPLECEYNNGSIDAYKGILRFIDSLPEEPASEDLDFLVISLEETIGTSPHSREVIKEHLQKAAEWGRNHFEDKNEMVSKDLEEEITKCYKSQIGLMMTRKQFGELIHRFTEWQKQKDKQLVGATQKISHQHGYDEGRFDMKEEMMKNAVDGWCSSGGNLYNDIRILDTEKTSLKINDKVKIIIVKTEQQ